MVSLLRQGEKFYSLLRDVHASLLHARVLLFEQTRCMSRIVSPVLILLASWHILSRE